MYYASPITLMLCMSFEGHSYAQAGFAGYCFAQDAVPGPSTSTLRRTGAFLSSFVAKKNYVAAPRVAEGEAWWRK